MSPLNFFDQWIARVWWWRLKQTRAEVKMNDAHIDDAAARDFMRTIGFPWRSQKNTGS